MKNLMKTLAVVALLATVGVWHAPSIMTTVGNTASYLSVYTKDIKNTEPLQGKIHNVVLVTEGKNLNGSTFSSRSLMLMMEYSKRNTIRAFFSHEWTGMSIDQTGAIGYYSNLRLVERGGKKFITGTLNIYAKHVFEPWYNELLHQIHYLGGSGIGLSVVISYDGAKTTGDHMEIRRWMSCDIVQNPAATENLFNPLEYQE